MCFGLGGTCLVHMQVPRTDPGAPRPISQFCVPQIICKLQVQTAHPVAGLGRPGVLFIWGSDTQRHQSGISKEQQEEQWPGATGDLAILCTSVLCLPVLDPDYYKLWP